MFQLSSIIVCYNEAGRKRMEKIEWFFAIETGKFYASTMKASCFYFKWCSRRGD